LAEATGEIPVSGGVAAIRFRRLIGTSYKFKNGFVVEMGQVALAGKQPAIHDTQGD
jgi:hypothetical protein